MGVNERVMLLKKKKYCEHDMRRCYVYGTMLYNCGTLFPKVCTVYKSVTMGFFFKVTVDDVGQYECMVQIPGRGSGKHSMPTQLNVQQGSKSENHTFIHDKLLRLVFIGKTSLYKCLVKS